MIKRRLLATSLATLALLVVGACGSSSSAGGGGVIKVGITGPFTGPYADPGSAIRNAGQLAIEDINAAGGVNGRPLQIVHVDDMETAVPATRPHLAAEAQRMVQPMLPARPGRRLAARNVLPRHPPAPHFRRALGIGDVVDDQDVADIALHLGRDVGVALVHVEAVHTDAAGLVVHDLPRFFRR